MQRHRFVLPLPDEVMMMILDFLDHKALGQAIITCKGLHKLWFDSWIGFMPLSRCLLFAIKSNCTERAIWLLDQGAAIHYRIAKDYYPDFGFTGKSDSTTPLLYAIFQGKDAFVELFAARQAYNLPKDDYEALYLAAYIGNHKSLQTMLEVVDNKIQHDVRMALFKIAFQSKEKPLFQVLSSQPCLKLHMQDEKGQSLFHLAATMFNSWHMNFLLDFCKTTPYLAKDLPQSLQIKNFSNETVFWLSIHHESFAISDLLLAEPELDINGAPPGKAPALWLALFSLSETLNNIPARRAYYVEKHVSSVVIKILERKDLVIVSWDDWCPLCFSVKFLSIKIAKHVLQRSDIPLQPKDHVCQDLIEAALGSLDEEPKIEFVLGLKHFKLPPQRAFELFTDFVKSRPRKIVQALVQRNWFTTSSKTEHGRNALEVAVGPDSLSSLSSGSVVLTNMNWSKADLDAALRQVKDTEIEWLIWVNMHKRRGEFRRKGLKT